MKFVHLFLFALAATSAIAATYTSTGNNQLSCAWSAALNSIETAGNLNPLYTRWFGAAPPSWFINCTVTWATCDSLYGSSPVSGGVIAQVKSQGYATIGTAISAIKINNVTYPADSGTPPSSQYGTAHGYYADLAGMIWQNIASHYSFSAPTIYWYATNFASPPLDNIIYKLNNATYDIGMGNAVINGTWVTPSGTSVARSTLVQFPSCPYNADSDAFLQSNLALPSGLSGALTTAILQSAAAASVKVCVQAGSTYDTQWSSRGFMANKTTEVTALQCLDDLKNQLIHAVYTSDSILSSAYASSPSSYYAEPIVVAGSQFNAYAMFRFDGSVSAAPHQAAQAVTIVIGAVVAALMAFKLA